MRHVASIRKVDVGHTVARTAEEQSFSSAYDAEFYSPISVLRKKRDSGSRRHCRSGRKIGGFTRDGSVLLSPRNQG